jgi:hypothetical protein
VLTLSVYCFIVYIRLSQVECTSSVLARSGGICGQSWTQLLCSTLAVTMQNMHTVAAALFLYNPLLTGSSSVPGDRHNRNTDSNKDTCIHTGLNHLLHLDSKIQGDRTAILLRPLAEEIFVIIWSAESFLTFRFVFAPGQSVWDF